MQKDINKIIDNSRKLGTHYPRLNHLEVDVWQNIILQKQDLPSGAFEKFLAFIFPAQHRLVPIMCACLIGLMLGSGALQINSHKPSASKMLGLKVFNSQVNYLSSITNNKERI